MAGNFRDRLIGRSSAEVTRLPLRTSRYDLMVYSPPCSGSLAERSCATTILPSSGGAGGARKRQYAPAVMCRSARSHEALPRDGNLVDALVYWELYREFCPEQEESALEALIAILRKPFP